MNKSDALLLYEETNKDLLRRFRAGEITESIYLRKRVAALKLALPKMKVEELSQIDRCSFDLLSKQDRGVI